MTLNDRQSELIGHIIRDYVRFAQPVSSEFLREKHKLEISPAMIRLEMQRLSDEGFLEQPHTSAGRVPTDKAYRFFVNEILEKEDLGLAKKEKPAKPLKKIEEEEDLLKFFQDFARSMAGISSTLMMSYWSSERFFFKEGWEEMLDEPEFSEKEFTMNFVKFLKNFESGIEENIERLDLDSGMKIYIGSENPLPNAKDVSLISLKLETPSSDEIVFSILGPKRMSYGKNIAIARELREIFGSLY